MEIDNKFSWRRNRQLIVEKLLTYYLRKNIFDFI